VQYSLVSPDGVAMEAAAEGVQQPWPPMQGDQRLGPDESNTNTNTIQLQ
jgi:hypothetical protein